MRIGQKDRQVEATICGYSHAGNGRQALQEVDAGSRYFF